MPDNETPLGFLSFPDAGDESWYSEDSSGQGLEDWLAAIELFGIPTYQSYADLPSANAPETSGDQRQFAAVVDDRTVYRTDGTEWVAWFGKGTSDRALSGTTHHEAVSTGSLPNTPNFPDERTVHGAEVETWGLIDEKVDTGLDTPLTIDAIDPDVYERLKIVIGYDGGVNNASVDATISGRTDANYNYTDGSSDTTGDTKFRLIDVPSSYGMVRGEWILNTSAPRPPIYGYGSDKSLSGTILQRGFYGDGALEITSLEISATDTLGGADRVSVWGCRS